MGKNILGLDLGGVVIDVWQGGNEKLFFSDKYLDTPAVVGAIMGVTALRQRFEGRLKFVSHCTEENQKKFVGWLEYHDFYEATGTRFEDITFCRQRGDKAAICRDLQITHFVDDRLEILSSLSSVESRFLFQSRDEDLAEYREYLPQVRVVQSWEELLAHI